MFGKIKQIAGTERNKEFGNYILQVVHTVRLYIALYKAMSYF